jgi:hypothetical protein
MTSTSPMAGLSSATETHLNVGGGHGIGIESDSGYSPSDSPPSRSTASSLSATVKATTNEEDCSFSADTAAFLAGDPDSEAGPDIAMDAEEFRSASEAFKDPNAFDFLSQHGGGGAAAAQLARESLYVKFDPLISGRQSLMPKSLTSPAANGHKHGGINTVVETLSSFEASVLGGGSGSDLIAMNSPSPARTKPSASIVLSPSVDGGSTTRNDAALSTASRPLNAAEQRLDFEEHLLKKDTRLSQLERLISESAESNEQLRLEAQRRRESEEQMKQVLKEYEKTISELIAEKEKEKAMYEEERVLLATERDQATEDLKNVETAFADVHRKYERTKVVVEGFKANEDTLRRLIEEGELKLRKQDQRYEMLKSHAEETLEKANKEIESMARSQDSEMARLTASLKKTEMKAVSLERTVDQKAKENDELTAICDELISKVGN